VGELAVLLGGGIARGTRAEGHWGQRLVVGWRRVLVREVLLSIRAYKDLRGHHGERISWYLPQVWWVRNGVSRGCNKRLALSGVPDHVCLIALQSIQALVI